MRLLKSSVPCLIQVERVYLRWGQWLKCSKGVNVERVVDVAQYVMNKYKEISGESLDEMKLHKLLYFAQRECFAVQGSALFGEDLEGWMYGPVSVDVRMVFASDHLETTTREVSPDAMHILDNVIVEYAPIESWKLSKMSHEELSWRNARKGLGPRDCGQKILALDDIRKDAEKVRPYDHVWDMYYDEFDDVEEVMQI